MAKMIDKDMQKNIDNYENSIKTISDLVQAIRQTPGVYIGALGNKGFINMIREVFQNSIDQMLDPGSPCDKIYMYYNEQTREVIVEDNGMGLPFNAMKRILTEDHTSKNYIKKPFCYSSGMHGQGYKAVNACSSKLIAESYHYSGEARRLTTIEGYPTTKEPEPILNKEKKQGTRTYFIPADLIGETTLDWHRIYTLVKRMISLTKIGAAVDFEAVDYKGETHKETIINKDGIITDLIMKMKKPIIKPIVLHDDTGEKKIDVAFCYDAEGLGEGNGPDPTENITSFSNMCPCTGTHLDGFLSGVTLWFTSYMNKIFLANQKAKIKLKVTPADIKCGLNVMISVAHLYPVFDGQAKSILSNQDMEPYVKTIVMQGLDDWSKQNPQDLTKLAKYFKELAEIRQKSENEKVKMVTKFAESATTGLPRKFARPLGKDHLELFIVEGDSAGGSAKDARDEIHQGIFPIRGKIKNAFSAPMQTVFNNEEVQGILKILFGLNQYKRGLTAADCKYEKIIFMADSDSDGYHINSLLLRLFLLYFPFLIEAGMVYQAVGPLFGVTNGKKTTYFIDRLDMVRFYQKEFVKHYRVYNGKNELDNKAISTLLLRNKDYLYEMNIVSNRYSVDPLLLEYIIVNYMNGHTEMKALKKDISSKYRFMTITEKKGTYCIEGVANSKYQTLYFNDKLINDCKEVMNIIKSNDQVYYNIDGKEASIYTIMKLFDGITPNNIQRYKGLGEMDANKLAESTMMPEGRTLIRYTIDDVKDTIEAVRNLESDKKQILAMIDHVSREELLG